MQTQNKLWQIIGLAFVVFLIVGSYNARYNDRYNERSNERYNVSLEEWVLPQEGIELPVVWGDLGKQMVEEGVIDAQKFEKLYVQRGGLTDEMQQLLYADDNARVKITKENAGFLLNLFWGFGLANKNIVLEQGPMVKYNGDASRFASTGGWTLAQDNPMAHYSTHEFIVLSPQQQKLVEEVSKNIYRPCCNNSTYFPDCNHGMAMLGLLELMAANGADEQEMYKAALRVNSYWFPQTYLTVANYFQMRGVEWADVAAKMVLGSAYSSVSGYRRILAEVEPVEFNRGGSCGV